MEFAKRLKQIRENAGFSQKEVAEKCGLTAQAYNNYEKRGYNPTPELLVKLAIALNTTPNDLLGFSTFLIDPIQYANKYFYGFKDHLRVKRNIVEYDFFLEDINTIADPDIEKVTIKIPKQTFIFFVEVARENAELQTRDFAETEKKRLFTHSLVAKMLTHYVRDKENLLRN